MANDTRRTDITIQAPFLRILQLKDACCLNSKADVVDMGENFGLPLEMRDLFVTEMVSSSYIADI